jgi:hypothetical protein
MTKHPSTKDRGEKLTWKEGRDLEEEFFKSTMPWCNEEKKKLGTHNLMMALTDVLSGMIAKRYVSQSFDALL